MDPDRGDNPSQPEGDRFARARAAAERLRASTTFAELEAEVAQAEPPRNFFRAVTRHDTPEHTAIVAEVARVEGADDDRSPASLAAAFQRAGAVAVSCRTERDADPLSDPATDPRTDLHTDPRTDLAACRAACTLPLLHRDCLVDPWQLWASRAAGADAVSLVAEALTESALIDMLILAQQLQMTVMIEVHGMEDLLRVRPHVGFPHPTYCLLGINNRDPNTRQLDVNQTLRLVDLVDDTGVLVSAGGSGTGEDIRRLRDVGVRAVLLGEALLDRPDPAAALALLTGSARRGEP